MSKERIELKVSSTSNPASVAGSIAKNLQEGKQVELVSIGAGAVNQASKAIATASGFVAPNGISLGTKIAWTTVEIDGQKKSAIKHILVEL